jgi:hypothetical protein
MILKLFWSFLTALLLSASIALMPTPAFAALTSVNSSTTAGSFVLPATQDKDLPGFTNTSDKPVTIKIQGAGTWAYVNQSRKVPPQFELYKVPFDGDGFKTKAGTTETNAKLKYPNLPGGALVATVTNAKGELKAEVSGKDQSIELQPGESVKFGFNDETTEYGDNAGSLKINYSIAAPCSTPEPITPTPKPPVPTPVPPVPTPAPPVPTPTPQKLGCNLDSVNANPEFFENVVYKSFEGDSPFRSLVSSSNPLTSSFSFSGSNTSSSEWFELEKFEGPKFENNTIGVKYRPNEIVKTSTDPTYWDSVDADDGNIDGASRSQGRFVLQKDGDIKFEFDNKRGLPTDVGLVWTDNHANAPKMDGYITFEPFDATGKSLGVRGPIYVGGDGKTVANPEDDRFFGVHYNGGISAFNVKSTVVQVGVEYDHLQYGRKCRD